MEIEKYEWSCIRTNNGEWISEIHTQILDDDELHDLAVSLNPDKSITSPAMSVASALKVRITP